MISKTIMENNILNKQCTLFTVSDGSFFLAPPLTCPALNEQFPQCPLQRPFQNQLSREAVVLIFIKILVVRKQQNS